MIEETAFNAEGAEAQRTQRKTKDRRLIPEPGLAAGHGVAVTEQSEMVRVAESPRVGGLVASVDGADSGRVHP